MSETRMTATDIKVAAVPEGGLDLIALARAHIESENAHDIDLTMSTISEKGASYWIYSSGQRPNTREKVRDFYLDVYESIPDMKLTVGDIIADPVKRLVMGQYHLTGTHLGPLNGLAPTGRSVEYHGSFLYEFDTNGKLIREETYFDKTELLASIGVMRDTNTMLGQFLMVFPQSPILLLKSGWMMLTGKTRKNRGAAH